MTDALANHLATCLLYAWRDALPCFGCGAQVEWADDSDALGGDSPVPDDAQVNCLQVVFNRGIFIVKIRANGEIEITNAVNRKSATTRDSRPQELLRTMTALQKKVVV